MSDRRFSDPTDVSDEEWALVASYLRLLDEEAGQRDHDLREVFNGLRYVVKTGIPWRFLPHDLPLWAAVYQQMQRWLAADCFVDIADDLRAVLRMTAEREPGPSAAVLDSRTLRSSPKAASGPDTTVPNARTARRSILAPIRSDIRSAWRQRRPMWGIGMWSRD